MQQATTSPAMAVEPERERSIHLSRGLKIEDLAASRAPGDAGGLLGSKLFSMGALSHAVSGSVGGNVAMLGAMPAPPTACRIFLSVPVSALLPAGDF